jgi:hypothetical protein
MFFIVVRDVLTVSPLSIFSLMMFSPLTSTLQLGHSAKSSPMLVCPLNY